MDSETEDSSTEMPPPAPLVIGTLPPAFPPDRTYTVTLVKKVHPPYVPKSKR